MDIESLFTESKWRILTELSKTPSSPTELADRTGTSLANISVQLRLLEAMNLVTIEKQKNVLKGEPRKIFTLKKPFCYFILSSYPVIGKKMIELDDESMFFFSVWLLKDPETSKALIKLYFEHEDCLSDASAIGYLGTKDRKTELCVFHPSPENLSHLQDVKIKFHKEDFHFKVHAHLIEEFTEGVGKKEEYYLNTIKRIFVLKDMDNAMSKLKKGAK